MVIQVATNLVLIGYLKLSVLRDDRVHQDVTTKYVLKLALTTLFGKY